ncbi:hypothetical protein L484_010325 [Morus notabilis]|uniref:Uncharacterized protein n=1 Tax=Morus notabilis TaxID=981085 RepID=W9QYL4_9ROSA|nr:hypothetical protein L484_010325 [Morus notabilis]
MANGSQHPSVHEKIHGIGKSYHNSSRLSSHISYQSRPVPQSSAKQYYQPAKCAGHFRRSSIGERRKRSVGLDHLYYDWDYFTRHFDFTMNKDKGYDRDWNRIARKMAGESALGVSSLFIVYPFDTPTL